MQSRSHALFLTQSHTHLSLSLCILYLIYLIIINKKIIIINFVHVFPVTSVYSKFARGMAWRQEWTSSAWSSLLVFE